MPPQSPDDDIHNGKCKVTLNLPDSCITKISLLIPWADPPRRPSEREYRRSTALAYEIQNHTFRSFGSTQEATGISPTEEVEDMSNVIDAYMHGARVSYRPLCPKEARKSGAILEGGFWINVGLEGYRSKKPRRGWEPDRLAVWSLSSVDLECRRRS